jgi:PAS domain S-box-containing protein
MHDVDDTSNKVTDAMSVPVVDHLPTADSLRLIYAAVQQANDAILITTAGLDAPEPRIVYANPAFEAMTGYTAAEVIGNTPRMLQGPQSDRGELDQVRATLERGDSYHGEIVNYRKNGSTYLLSWRIDPIRDAGGTITHWVSVQRDVSEEYAAKEERARLLHQAQQAMRLRNDLLSMVSHELKTPLTSLLGFTHLLERQHTTAAQQQRAVHTIAKQAQRLHMLIEEVLDLERIQSGMLTLRMEPVDVGVLAERVVAEHQPLLRAQQTLTLHNPSEPVRVGGDTKRLEHVLQHLIQNAVTFSPHGGTIAVMVNSEDNQARITVGDQGIGIPAAAQAHIFERFYRASNVEPLQVGGFGVGLYVVHEIVKRHGGTIAVESTEDGGSTFTVCLPQA